MKFEELDRILDQRDYPALGQALLDHPGTVRKLVSRLHQTDETRLRKTLEGFQIAAKLLNREKLLDLVRRLMWMLNEESGNNCPNAALALGHIAQVDPGAVEPHLPVLRVYAEDPSIQLRGPVRKSISMIRMAMAREGRAGQAE